MIEPVKLDLSKEEKSEFHESLLHECLADIKKSRSKMGEFYEKWDLQDQVFRGERYPDTDDRKQASQGKPEKMIVPTTRSQIESFVSFLFLLFTQNATPFELTPTGTEDFGHKWEDCEAVLTRDCSRSSWNKIIYQFLLDVGRFGLAPLEVSWGKESTKVWIAPEANVQQDLNGIPLSSPEEPGYKEFVKFEGNRVRNISPYRWFPDTNFPISDFQRGNYCAHEEDYTLGGLRKMEKDGEVAGIDYIEALERNLETFRGAESRFSFGKFPSSWDNSNDSAPVCVTKERKWITPSKYTLCDSKPLGTEDFPILYTIWYANDNRIIKCEPCVEWHQEFNYSIGQYSSDIHHFLTLGLANLIYPLQDTISWFLNSHITSVRRVIQNRMIINPTLIETKSYDGEGDIFMRKGFGKTDPRLGVSQLPAQDVTQGHMTDVDILGKLTQAVTGVNDNLQGQMNTGRRSAQENRVQTAGAAGRLKTLAKLLWESGLGRCGKLMLSNSRQSLSQESFARAIGGNPADLPARYSEFKGTPEEIICGEDYLVFDTTLSSEKGFMAQQLQELVSMILQSNPQAAMQLTSQIDLSAVIDEMFWLRDGTPVARFKYKPGQQPMVPPQLMGPNGVPMAAVPPLQPQQATA